MPNLAPDYLKKIIKYILYTKRKGGSDVNKINEVISTGSELGLALNKVDYI